MSTNLEIISLNIGNPSLERAKIQAKWLEERHEDVLVLTETKNSEGCAYIEEYFLQYGYSFFTMNSEKTYNVFFPKSTTGDLGVMIISRLPMKNTYTIFDKDNAFYTRFAGCDVVFNGQDIHVIGLYVPSRDRSEEKISRKKEFCIEAARYLKKIGCKMNCVVCGDLNILDRNHIPQYNTFFDWEYAFYDFFDKNNLVDAYKLCNPNSIDHSWVGRTNDGYRYDYCFVNKEIETNVINSYYLHEPRGKITDHSAIITQIKIKSLDNQG